MPDSCVVDRPAATSRTLDCTQGRDGQGASARRKVDTDGEVRSCGAAEAARQRGNDGGERHLRTPRVCGSQRDSVHQVARVPVDQTLTRTLVSARCIRTLSHILPFACWAISNIVNRQGCGRLRECRQAVLGVQQAPALARETAAVYNSRHALYCVSTFWWLVGQASQSLISALNVPALPPSDGPRL